jgi:hypothetical protein
VRDRGGEAGAQLLVRSEVARLGEVDEPLRTPSTSYGTTSGVGRYPQQSRRQRLALATPSSDWRAPRLAATTSPLVEDDDRLAALLDHARRERSVHPRF